MSNLFNLSAILSENTSNTSLVRAVEEVTYLSEGVSLLRSMDKELFECKCDMYTDVLEATSKRDENGAFGCYFKRYKDVVDKYILKLQSLASQFAINIETFADANSDILDMADGASILNPTQYTGVGYSYPQLTSIGSINIDPYQVFKKEFAFLGKLMQDLGPLSSEEDKTQVIATVFNNLTKELDDGWLTKEVKNTLAGAATNDTDFARAVYNKFVVAPSKDMIIDIGLVKQCKLDIANAELFTQVITKAINVFCKGLTQVADEIGSLFYRNQDHKFPLKTDVDGIEDKTYRFGDYSYNQMNMFITTKISQITELCNLYIIAITIQMDCIYKYLQQCKDIIHTANAGVDTTPNTKSDPGDVDIDDDGAPESDDYGTEDCGFDDEGCEGDTEECGDSPADESSDDGNLDDNLMDDDPSSSVDNSETDIEEACYLFEADVLQMENFLKDYYLKKNVHLAITEGMNGSFSIKSAKDAAKSLGQRLLARIKELFAKMRDKMSAGELAKRRGHVIYYKSQIEKAKIPDHWNDFHRPDLSYVDKFDYKDITAGDFTTEEKGYNTYKEFLGNGKSISERIQNKIFDEKTSKFNESDRGMALGYVIDGHKKFVEKLNNIEKKLDAWAKTNKPADAAAANSEAQKESALNWESTLLQYFYETTPGEGGGGEQSGGDTGTKDTQPSKPGDDGQKKGDGTFDVKDEDKAGGSADDSKDIFIRVTTKMISGMMAGSIRVNRLLLQPLLSLAEIAGKKYKSGDYNDNGERTAQEK